MDKYSKEGNLSGAMGAVIGLIVGVGISVLVLVFVGVLGGQTYQMSEPLLNAVGNNAVVGESVTALTNTTVSLAYSPLWTGTLTLVNGTKVVGLGNFTVDYTAGTLYYLGAVGNYNLNNTALAANYTWGQSDINSYIKGSIMSGFQALQTTGNYLPIIVLAVVITLVMALILSMSSMHEQGGSGMAL